MKSGIVAEQANSGRRGDCQMCAAGERRVCIGRQRDTSASGPGDLGHLHYGVGTPRVRMHRATSLAYTIRAAWAS